MEEITKETNLTSNNPAEAPANIASIPPPAKKSRPSLVIIVTLVLIGILLIGVAIFVYSGLTRPKSRLSTKTPNLNEAIKAPTPTSTSQSLTPLSKENESCGPNAGAAGDAKCESGLTCVYQTMDAQKNKIGTCVAKSSEIYTGEVSPVVPYKGLKFKEIDVHNFKPLDASLSASSFQENGNAYDGYTFTATKGEDFEFLAEEKKDPLVSFIHTELYGYGPTVIKMDTRIGWGVPTTGRYFYVVKGSDLYGNTPANKFGNYTLSITQRK